MRVIQIVVILVGVGLVGGGIFYVVNPLEGEVGVVAYVPAAIQFFFAAAVFALFLPMVGGFAGQGRLLRAGEPASATILEVEDTAGTVNEQPVFRFTLQVRRADGSTYQATCKQVVSRASLGALQPGITVPVRVDPRRPHRVAIDSKGGPATMGPRLTGAMPPGLTGAMPGVRPGAAPSVVVGGAVPGAASHVVASGIPAGATVRRAADVIRDGIPTIATVRLVTLTGATVGQMQPDADPATAAHPLVILVMDVALTDGQVVTAQGAHRVPPEQLARLVPGATLPVVYLAGSPATDTTVDWDRLPLFCPG